MKFQRKSKIPLRHEVIIGTVVASIVKCILRYLLMAGYILACNEVGFYNYGLIVKVVVTITSICLSRWILREIGRCFCNELDEPMFNDIGIVACIRNVVGMIDRWN